VLTKRAWSVFAFALLFVLAATPAAFADDSTTSIISGVGGLCCVVIWLGVVGGLAYWVYTDATSRGANGVLWALITFFGCFPIGLIVYFVVRPEKRT
jgi:hypothetical protein